MSFLECQPGYVVYYKKCDAVSCLLDRILIKLSDIIYINMFLLQKNPLAFIAPDYNFLMWILVQESVMHPILFCQ